MSSTTEEYDEERADGCCDSCVTKIQRLLKPISPWIPALKNVTASGADVVTDWLFYLRIAGDETGTLTEFVWPLFAFSVLSTIFLIIIVFAEISKQCCPGCANSFLDSKLFCCCCSCMKTMKFISLCEIILEDIPQILISNWIRQEQIGWTTAAIVNIITSSYNVAFDLFGMLELTPQETERLAKRN
mmetsp:Transcript_31320/g.56767  ORF Transcript_31320/g.56767 Transcript_31320/m.56767 type:complete len:187 (-) Transcript_31320:224-784(-)